jgi:hypothetical protein
LTPVKKLPARLSTSSTKVLKIGQKPPLSNKRGNLIVV